jgi:hypothetical protein
MFDELAKVIAEESLPRRESLRRLGLAITATVLSPLGADFARAGHKPKAAAVDPCKSFCQCGNKKQRDQCLKACNECGKVTSRLGGSCGSYFCCGTGQASCGSYCADLANDPYNCGDCGYVCQYPGPYEDGACVDGQCVYTCSAGAVRCSGTCTSLLWDANNCGACGNVCPASNPVCNNGTCTGCGPGLTNCSGVCTDLNWDSENCGACGAQCGNQDICYTGVCVYYCDPDGPYPC